MLTAFHWLKMVGVYAESIPACVVQVQTGRDGPSLSLIKVPVRSNRFGHATALSDSDLAVTLMR